MSGFLAWRNLHNAIFPTVYISGRWKLFIRNKWFVLFCSVWLALLEVIIYFLNKQSNYDRKMSSSIFSSVTDIFTESEKPPKTCKLRQCSTYLKFSTHIIWCFKTFQAGLTSQMNKCPPRRGWINDLFF